MRNRIARYPIKVEDILGGFQQGNKQTDRESWVLQDLRYNWDIGACASHVYYWNGAIFRVVFSGLDAPVNIAPKLFYKHPSIW